MKFKEYPTHEQPSTRIREIGPQCITDAELFALATFISDAETAQALAKVYHDAGSLGKIRRDQITSIPGLGQGYADAILAIYELARRDIVREQEKRPTIHSPADAAQLVQYEMSALDHEEMRIMLLDTRNNVIRTVTLYKGSVNSCQVRISEMFRDAIREGAPNIIIIHNHPSGDPSPSPDDIALTRTVVQAGTLMDITVLDHLVIGQGRWVSLKERGLGFS